MLDDQETTLNYQEKVMLEEKFPESITTTMVVHDRAVQTEDIKEI